jgi:hypothetical protein
MLLEGAPWVGHPGRAAAATIRRVSRFGAFTKCVPPPPTLPSRVSLEHRADALRCKTDRERAWRRVYYAVSGLRLPQELACLDVAG